MNKKILLVGNYGAGNHGDDLLKKSAMLGLERYFPGSEIKVMSPEPDADFCLPAAGIRSFIKGNSFESMKGFKWADMVVFGGGGLLNSEVPYSIFIWGRVIKKAKSLDLPVYMLGQSFEGEPTDNLVKLLSKLDFLTCRDSGSSRFIERLNIDVASRTTSDLAFCLDAKDLPGSASRFTDEEFIALNIREYDQLNYDILYSVLDEIVSYFSEKTPYSIYLVPFGKDDSSFAEEIVDRYKTSGRLTLVDESADSCFSALRSAKAIISSRLHPNIVAMILGKPFLSLSYSSKSKGILRDLDLTEYNFDLRNPGSRKLDVQIKELLKRPVYEIPSSIKQAADNNFRFLKLYTEAN